ncbi:MAG: formate/nitrite transporter family protein [Methylobacterium sp.]|uniref:formate/nitrite transporter family protein n=1 Tax=Methylobacterium sp. TaxID=409 RepID=UPI002718F6E4|nr:formate/nitrite transporter family protein [Methylobacterium sp.]MDO9425980.1 formate/nitrite transporter family protein [Methylobacterium sp.]
MDYVKPAEMAAAMSDSGVQRAQLSITDMLVRGMMSGAILGIATSLAITGAVQTGVPFVGALVFPVGFVMIVCLGLELCTGNFGILGLSFLDGRVGFAPMMRNFAWGFVGNLLGSVLYALLLVIALSNAWHTPPAGVAQKIIDIASAKTIAYEALGSAGMLTVFVKAMLCNWMVCLGVTMAMMSTSTFGKILGAWLPVFLFFAQGFEHAVVNMFVIPAGMMLGAPVSFEQWWVWNQIPVTLGNFVGGVLFISVAWYLTYRPRAQGEPARTQAPVGAAVRAR